MIKVTRLGSGDEFVINADLILTVEAKPDTVITLTTGHKFIVEEDIDEVVRRVVAYRRSVMQPLQG
ncbi:MAG: flagellar FlbD family protein [Firmicutes bacterium]|nr:flagellar FlbD family protein [Bacillota bacterium]